jgi:hypothetical protein
MRHSCVIHALVPSDCECFDSNRSPTEVNSKGTRMLNRNLRKIVTATSAALRGRRLQHITRRLFGKKAFALAVALGAAATTLIGLVITTPTASAASLCVNQTLVFSPNTYQSCVRDEQILLNDLWYVDATNASLYVTDQLLTVDGYYGSHTANDVSYFNQYGADISTEYVGETTPATWTVLCRIDFLYGFHGAYWQDAGCAATAYL